MDLECAGSTEQTYSRLASVITDGVRSGKEQTMIVIDGIKIVGAVFVIIYVVAVIKGSRR